jgi:predicted TIM-barrel fold metal-dependent hydrolase
MSFHRRFICFPIIAAAALALPACAAEIEMCKKGEACIPIIDAHSQADHHVDLDGIVPLMDKAGIARVILATRGRLNFRELADFARRHPGRITASVRTKGRVYDENRDKYYRRLRAQLAMPEFGAMAELLIYHAAKHQRGAPEVVMNLDSPQVAAAVTGAKEKGWPIVLHFEFASFPGDRKKLMRDLESFLRSHRPHPVALIHLGQLQAPEARRLLAAHANVYFMASHANPVMVNRSNQPWVNMFDGDRLAPQWRALVLRHPGRFVLAFDNVWAEHWEHLYLPQVAVWRKALAGLPPEAAHKFAHGNAERLWRLPPAKLRR